MGTATPHTFQELLKAIDDKMFMLQATWRIYRQLFGTSEARVELLNKFVPDGAGIIQRVLLDSVILAICRLCDAPGERRNKNLTLMRLVESLSPQPDAKQAAYFDKKLNSVKGLVDALRKHRHKRIAHSDLSIAMAKMDVLPGVSRQVVEDVLQAIRELLNTINLAYLHQEVAYEFVELHGDGDALIWCLQMTERLADLQDVSWSRKTSEDTIIQKLRDRTFPDL